MGERTKIRVKRENLTSHTKKNNLSKSATSPIDNIMFLQRSIGNQAVQRLFNSRIIQTKLKISQPNDIYEQEADRVAEQVMRMKDEEVVQRKTHALQITPLVQRQTTVEGEIQPKLNTSEISMIHRQVEEEEEKKEEEVLQTKRQSGQIMEATPDIESRINTLKGGGQPLPESTRAFFEPLFGLDFSQVRVHIDSTSARLSRQLNAQASTPSGRRLLAHELTHVVQQSVGQLLIHRNPSNNGITQMSITPEYAQILNDADLQEQINILRTQLIEMDPNDERYDFLRTNLRVLEAEVSMRREVEESYSEEEIAQAGLIATGRVLQTMMAPETEMLRNIYNQGVARIAAEGRRLRALGLSEHEIAIRLSQMRHELALKVRRIGSDLMRKAAEVFDKVRGNVGRPTYESLRAAGKTDAQIIESATRTNRFINRLPIGLRWAGRALLFVSAGISVYVITTTPPEQRGQVIQEEVGGFFGGILGASAVEGLCIITGIATEGLGLIVCGLFGGILGFEVGREGSILQILDIAPHNVPDLAGRMFRVEGDWEVTDLFLFSIVHRRVEASEHVVVISTGKVSGEMIGGRGHYRMYEVIPVNRAAEALFRGENVKWIPNYLLTPATQADLLASED